MAAPKRPIRHDDVPHINIVVIGNGSGREDKPRSPNYWPILAVGAAVLALLLVALISDPTFALNLGAFLHGLVGP